MAGSPSAKTRFALLPGHDDLMVPAEHRNVVLVRMAKPNPHPGEILLEEFLKPMGLSQNGLARAVHVAPRRINEIVLGKRDITADTDLRLARYFGLSEGFFLGLQMDYDLMQRRREIDRDLKTIRPRAA
jgi:antitoxin HigA-1